LFDIFDWLLFGVDGSTILHNLRNAGNASSSRCQKLS
jgi:hypothetical protein